MDLASEENDLGDEDEEECSVCFENLSGEGRPTRQLKCLHVFHHDCIQEWLLRDPRCPFCKASAAPAAQGGSRSARLDAAVGAVDGARRRERALSAPCEDAAVFTEIISRAGGDGAGGDALVDCQLTILVGARALIPTSRLHLLWGHRYGLVGRNGVGKSLLLSQLAEGGVPRAAGSRVALVAQEELPGSETVLQRLVSGDERRHQLLIELESLEAVVDPGADAAERVARITDELERIGGFDAEERAEALARGLGFEAADLARPVRELSGGWRMRLSLARALFAAPDLLLLDEVTNHLDLETVLWLEKWLVSSLATVVVVSHDASFLDAVITDVAYLGPEGLHCEKGSYSSFEEHADQHRAHQERLLGKRRVQEDKMHKSKEDMQRRARIKGDENAGKAAVQLDKKLQRIGLYRDDGKRYKLYSLESMHERWMRQPERIEAIQADVKLRFKFPVIEPAPGSELVTMQDACFTYGHSFRAVGQLLRNVTLEVLGKTRAAIVGRNGAGKSTLLRLLNGELEPTVVGSVRRRPQAGIATVSQHHLEGLKDFLSMSPAAYLLLRKGDLLRNDREARTYLGRFGLPGLLALTPLGKLSGGLRTRLVLAEALLAPSPPQLLLLDEPTNHLDFESMEALAIGLEAFQGAVVVVSHNVSFLSAVCKELWIVADGRVRVLQETRGHAGFLAHFKQYADSVQRDSDRELHRRGGTRRAVAVRGQGTHTSAAV